ncbi:nucleotidyltransferase family protein [archaeon]|nr:MAG: nucleotidyltransferase family protein [archaeon]
MFKHRTSIEFPPELWKQLSSKVPDRKKGPFIIEAVKEKLSRESMKAIILCGGQGTQMRPLTLSSPKGMLPIGYKPLLEHTVAMLKEQGIYNLIFAVGYLGEQIIKYFNDGSNFGTKINYLTEKEPLGTGGAVKQTENMISSTFIVVNGDIIFSKLDLKELLQFHKDKQALCTVVLTKVSDARPFGLVETDADGKIKAFTEKPKFSSAGWVNAGIYVLEPEIFQMIKPNKHVSLEADIFPSVVENGKLFAFKHSGYWTDVGKPNDYERVLKDFFAGKIR